METQLSLFLTGAEYPCLSSHGLFGAVRGREMLLVSLMFSPRKFKMYYFSFFIKQLLDISLSQSINTNSVCIMARHCNKALHINPGTICSLLTEQRRYNKEGVKLTIVQQKCTYQSML